MAKNCIYKSPAELPSEMTMKHFENALGVSRSTAYRFVRETDEITYRVGFGETGIRIRKQSFLKLIGYVPLDLDEELASTPLIWTIEDIARYRGKAPATIYEEARRDDFPRIPGTGKRIVVCREAWLVYMGYQTPSKPQPLAHSMSPITRALMPIAVTA
ncbi:hypothetical protein [Tumebacillus lipolyticus]|uniref:Helix-turn-helix domain-containing protein n=1 Tax=Tumebacillus lipolyticus TaxID=1280370 RepID=A0ABW5A4C4_9BACL